METSDAGLSKPAFNASLSNSTSYFKRGSKQLGALRPTRVWEILCLTSNASLSNSALWDVRVYNKQREIRIQRKTYVSIVTDPITGSINSQRNKRVNPHYGEILGDNHTSMTLYK